MNRRRRGLLLIGLALVLGGMAAMDIQRRENELDARLAPLRDVVVTTRALPADKPIPTDALTVRRVPERWAPAGAASTVDEVAGAAPGDPLPEGSDVALAELKDPGDGPGAPVAEGERAVPVVALGSRKLIKQGSFVDVLVNREGVGTSIPAQNVEVLDVGAPPDSAGGDAGEQVAATLRVKVKDALTLAQAQANADSVRLWPRASGDDRKIGSAKAKK